MTAAHQSGPGAILGANRPNRFGTWQRFSPSTDHRQIGAMYLVFAVAAGLIAGSPTFIARAQFIGPGYGAVIAFFTVIPALIGGFGSWFVPPMLGAPNMAFPRMHNVAFWLLVLSFTLLLTSLFVAAGYAGTARYPAIGASPAISWVLASIYLACVSSILLAINFITTILSMRAPSVTLEGMPILVWSILVAAILLLLWPPVVAGAVTLLSTDAHIGTGTIASAGDSNLAGDPRGLLVLAHPELFILTLLGFGIVGEIFTSSRIRAFAYRAAVGAMAAIGLIGFLLWAHSVYTGASASSSYFLLAALVIAVPASIMIVSWLAAILRERASFQTPMIWATGFVFVFVAGGTITAILAGAPVGLSPPDDSSVLANLQDVLLLDAIFATFAAWYYWFPKITGLLYNEALGKLHFWITFVGVSLVFVTERFSNPAQMLRQYVDSREADASWQQSTVVGGYIVIAGVAIFLVCMAEAFVRRQPANHNPWKALTPEWASSSLPLFDCSLGFPALNRARVYVPVTFVACSIVLAAILVSSLEAPPSQLGQLARENPSQAPDVAFTDSADKTHHLSEFKGRYILLNLWATWCAPCVREVPALARLSVAMPRNRFLVVPVAVPPGSAEETHAFLAAHEASALPSYFDPRTTAFNVFHAYGLPLTILIDPHGREIARAQGPIEWDAPETVAHLKVLSGIR